MTYGEAYQYGVCQLQNHDISEAELDARLLLEFVCNTNRHYLLVHGQDEITSLQEETYLSFIEKRKERIPLQYITGVQEFMGLEFFVNENVLIPRQDTEVLVQEVMRELHDGMSILDMCTGSGCILLSLLNYSNQCKGKGVDYSKDALCVAMENAKKWNLEAEFIESNLFENVTGKFDIIVSNPPYIRSEEIEQLMPEVKDHEPRMALDGTLDGLFFYREIVKESRKFLNRGGLLFFEIGCDQKQDVTQIFEQYGYCNICCVDDLAGLNRVMSATFLEEKNV